MDARANNCALFLPYQVLCVRSMSATPSSRAIALPQEIWWLVSQEFTSRRDFLSLFNLARVNRSMANMALPLLYRCVDLISIPL